MRASNSERRLRRCARLAHPLRLADALVAQADALTAPAFRAAGTCARRNPQAVEIRLRSRRGLSIIPSSRTDATPPRDRTSISASSQDEMAADPQSRQEDPCTTKG